MTRIQGNPFGLPNRNAYSPSGFQLEASVQARFFNLVYAWMAGGLGLTALVAWVVATNRDLQAWALNGPALIVAFVVEIALVLTISSAINRVSASAATALFLLYSAINGFVLSILFLRYTASSIGGTFVVTAGMFAAMSVYGFVTKRDLTRIGSLLFMALVGIILASLVNLFLHSPLLYWGITYAGVVIFVGLIAYDTQRLKEIAEATANDSRLASRLAIVGSLTLYLDFINLFLMLLRLMGNRRSD